MCRWFAYISTKEILLEDALVNPVHAITQQVRGDFQEENLVDADGFGIAWYSKTWSEFNKADAFGPQPALYRATNGKPLNDATFRYLCRGAASNVILSHLRGAFGAVASTNNHPFVFGRSSFMHNGFIMKFQDIRPEMLKKIRPRYAKMIGGSTDTEHLAALYFSYLEKEKPIGYYGSSKERQYSAHAMWNALQRAIRQVEELQTKRFQKKLNNTLNICTTNGESLVALCYRTNPWAPPATLYVSATVPDKLDRTSDSYEEPKERTLPELKQEEEDAKKFKADPLRGKNELKEGQPTSIIIASEPVTFCEKSWYKIESGQAVLVDTMENNEGDASLKVEVGFMPLARASCVIHPDHPEQAIMFLNNLFAILDTSPLPGKAVRVVEGVRDISTSWEKSGYDLPNLSSGIDAVLPDPMNKWKMHFFGGDEYVCVNIIHGKSPLALTVQKPPSTIVEVWKCFSRMPNFTSITTILLVPGRQKQAWFFNGSGSEYVLVSWTQDNDGTITSSKIESPPNKVADLPWLGKTGFSTVNMTLPHWKDKRKAWFFSGERVALVEINPNVFSKSKLIPLGGEDSELVQKHWPGCFYEKPEYPAVPSFNQVEQDTEDDKREKAWREERRRKRKEREDCEESGNSDVKRDVEVVLISGGHENAEREQLFTKSPESFFQ